MTKMAMQNKFQVSSLDSRTFFFIMSLVALIVDAQKCRRSRTGNIEKLGRLFINTGIIWKVTIFKNKLKRENHMT